jgi:plasmid stabilization system protein ParE
VFRIRIEAEAKDNLREHYQSLRSRNRGAEYPDRGYAGIRSAIRDLATSAQGCGLAYEDRFFAETIRQRLFDAYKILFVIREDRVHVLHIRHQAQDPEDLLG